MVQWSLPDAMKRDSSLKLVSATRMINEKREDLRVNELDADAKRPRHAVERKTPVRLQELVVREDAHFSDVKAGVL